jgi:hypothetical protein
MPTRRLNIIHFGAPSPPEVRGLSAVIILEQLMETIDLVAPLKAGGYLDVAWGEQALVGVFADYKRIF